MVMSSGMPFIIANNSTDILKIKRIEVDDHIAGFEEKNAIHIYISSTYYTYEQVRDYFVNNDISSIELHFHMDMAPDTYETLERSVLCDTYKDYTKELDISYESATKFFCVTLQKQTTASLNAKQCQQQQLEDQASLVELLEGGM